MYGVISKGLLPVSFPLFSLLIVISQTGCKTPVESCEDSSVCVNGYSCNRQTGECESTTLAEENDGGKTNDNDNNTNVACPTQSHSCVGAPQGWLGPVVGMGEVEDSEPTACGEGYKEAMIAKREFESNGSCSCFCPGNATGVRCGPAILEPSARSSADGCPDNTFPTSFSLSSTDCEMFPKTSFFIEVTSPKVTFSGSCASPEESNDFSTVFHKQESFCSLIGNGAGFCKNQEESCLPNKTDSASQSGACVYQVGELACPEAFPIRSLKYRAVEDTRSCTSCSCPGASIKNSCGGEVRVSSRRRAVTCGDDGNLYSDGCYQLPQTRSRYHASYVPPATPVTHSCEATKQGGNRTGKAAPTDAMTICCKE